MLSVRKANCQGPCRTRELACVTRFHSYLYGTTSTLFCLMKTASSRIQRWDDHCFVASLAKVQDKQMKQKQNHDVTASSRISCFCATEGKKGIREKTVVQSRKFGVADPETFSRGI